MKYIIILIILLSVKLSFGQESDAIPNGQIFIGKATEITPPDVDRMPIVLDEVIRFVNGKLYSDVMKSYSLKESNFKSEVDNRRAMAYKVVNFTSSSTDNIDGKNVVVDFSGNVYGDRKLSGNLVLRYPDGTELKFLVSAESQ